MIPYLSIIVFIFLTKWIVGEKYKSERKAAYLIWALIPVFIIMAFRNESVGADTPAYIELLKSIQNEQDLSNIEYEMGYAIFSKFIANLFEDPQWLFIITSLFVCISIGQFIYRSAKDPALALLFFITLGFFQFTLSGIRQSMAIAITLWLYPFITNKRFIPFAIGIAIAVLFHKSALLFVPAYFMAQQKLTRAHIIYEFIGFFLLFFLADSLLVLTADLLEYDYGIEETGNGYIFFIIVLLITLIGFRNKAVLLKLNNKNKQVININFISFSLWGVRLLSRTAERATLYYMPYTYLLLEEYVTSKKNNTITYLIVAFLVTMLFLYRLRYSTTLVPYRFCSWL